MMIMVTVMVQATILRKCWSIERHVGGISAMVSALLLPEIYGKTWLQRPQIGVLAIIIL